jgi:hypothetical protein
MPVCFITLYQCLSFVGDVSISTHCTLQPVFLFSGFGVQISATWPSILALSPQFCQKMLLSIIKLHHDLFLRHTFHFILTFYAVMMRLLISVPLSYLYFAPFNPHTTVVSANTVYCHVFSEQTAIISLNSVKQLVFVVAAECVYCAVRAEYLWWWRSLIRTL